MIELTEEQADAMKNPGTVPPRLVNPLTKETFVLIRADEYERLRQVEYDDSPWTRDELQAVAWEAAERAGWQESDETDAAPGKP
jgi:hypothetical protein